MGAVVEPILVLACVKDHHTAKATNLFCFSLLVGYIYCKCS